MRQAASAALVLLYAKGGHSASSSTGISMPDGVPLCLSSAAQSHVQVSSLSRGAQHWAQHATGLSTEQRNHETAYIQLVEQRRPGASAKRAGSRNDFRRAGVFRGRTLQILSEGFTATQVQATQHFRPIL